MVIFSHDYYVIGLDWDEFTANPNMNNFFSKFLEYERLRDYKGRVLKIAPVIRLYGANMFGQKCCIHVHGVPLSFFSNQPLGHSSPKSRLVAKSFLRIELNKLSTAIILGALLPIFQSK